MDSSGLCGLRVYQVARFRLRSTFKHRELSAAKTQLAGSLFSCKSLTGSASVPLQVVDYGSPAAPRQLQLKGASVLSSVTLEVERLNPSHHRKSEDTCCLMMAHSATAALQEQSVINGSFGKGFSILT